MTERTYNVTAIETLDNKHILWDGVVKICELKFLRGAWVGNQVLIATDNQCTIIVNLTQKKVLHYSVHDIILLNRVAETNERLIELLEAQNGNRN